MERSVAVVEESTPARAPTVHSDVTALLLGALVGACIATLIAGALCIANERRAQMVAAGQRNHAKVNESNNA